MPVDVQDQIKQLRAQLDALAQIKTQEDFDEGARLHAEKNAPWVNGPYSGLKFPPYVFQAYPKMLYSEGYEAASRAYDEAQLIPARGDNDGARKAAQILAERARTACTRIVQNAREHETLGSGWYESPTDAAQAITARENEIATLAAHRAYEDRNMSEAATREIDAVDERADHFVTEIPEQKRGPGRPRTVPTAAAVKEPA